MDSWVWIGVEPARRTIAARRTELSSEFVLWWSDRLSTAVEAEPRSV
ncbi:hypothetical protein [Oxynema aestuarii]|jgi:hypothetical protein|uniref:Uncharacterized protein n=1 Tax=Oxynema aestuarii AP17 TaxID=2064643 RepID=A0A6H1TWX6_9CYAN|nr:hypothetical protein [Oxynema aestuarii]QIZ71118.1 hypothetical protein HCG48_11480 [Oxynema aestuarii AP17]